MKTKKAFGKETFNLCIIENKADPSQNIYALFSELRLHTHFKNIPAHAVIKQIRGDDEACEDATIENRVVVNHNGDLMIHPGRVYTVDKILLPTEHAFIDISAPDKDGVGGTHRLHYTDKHLTYKAFCKMMKPQLDSIYNQSQMYRLADKEEA